MKKFLALALLVAFLSGTVIGCGGTPTTGKTTPAADSAKKEKDKP